MILKKYQIPETVTTRKIYQGDSLMHPKNEIQQKMSRPFQYKVYDEGDTNEKNLNLNESQPYNDNSVRNFDKEQKYKEYDQCK